MSPNPTPSLFSTYYHYVFLGGPGSIPLVISLSPLALLYKTSKQIFTPHLSLSPFVSLPGGCPPILLYHSFTYCHYYSLVVQGVSPLLILSSSCFNLHNHNTDINTPFVPFPFSLPGGCLPNPSFTIFYLLLLLFPGGSRGSPPGYFSLSLASIYKTSKEILTPPFSLSP